MGRGMDRWMDGCVIEWVYVLMNRWMHRWWLAGGQMSGWMDDGCMVNL